MNLLLIFLGIILIIIFIMFLYKISKISEIHYGELSDKIIELNLKKDQKYKISFFEGNFIDDNGMCFALYEKLSKERVFLKKYFFKYQFFYKGLKGFNYYSFVPKNNGIYVLEIKGTCFLEMGFGEFWLIKIFKVKKRNLQRKFLIKEG
jgi:hypothetical protein